MALNSHLSAQIAPLLPGQPMYRFVKMSPSGDSATKLCESSLKMVN
jgi:hypothetical protein